MSTRKPRPIPDPPGTDPLAIISQEQAKVYLNLSVEEQRKARARYDLWWNRPIKERGKMPDDALAYCLHGTSKQYLRCELERYLHARFNVPPTIDVGTVAPPRTEEVTAAAISAIFKSHNRARQ